MDENFAQYLLEKTKNDYNLISQDFANSRHFTWDIEKLSQYIKERERILDLGCGNGRLIEILKEKKVEYYGVDFSEKLIEIAQKNYPHFHFQVANALNLPFSDNFFDKIFSIRVIAHIPSRDFRLQFLKEIKRVLKPEGLLILTTWYLWNLKFKRNFFLMLKNIFLKIIGKSKLDFGDAFIPWQNKIWRYYHYFTKKELKKLVLKAGFKIEKIWTNSFDIYLIAKN